MSEIAPQMNGMQRAAAKFNAGGRVGGRGGQSELARRLGVAPQSVQHWCLTGLPPTDRVVEIERLTGISRHALRPDLSRIFRDKASRKATV